MTAPVGSTSPEGTATAGGLGGTPCVGVDLVDVAEVAASVARFGDAYERRVFTERERAQCTGSPLARAASLAARFAAKEATMKVLEPEVVRPDWRGIEVDRLPSGACRLRLSGSAGVLAARRGLRTWAVSLTHHGGLAAAVVVAVSDEAAHPWDGAPGSTDGAPQGSSRDALVGERATTTPAEGRQ